MVQSIVKERSLIDEIISRNVVRLREDRGWSREKLSEEYGCSYQYISHLETGHRGFGRKTFKKLLQVFGVSEKELLEMPEGLMSKDLEDLWRKFQAIQTHPDAVLFNQLLNHISTGDRAVKKVLEGALMMIQGEPKEEPPEKPE